MPTMFMFIFLVTSANLVYSIGAGDPWRRPLIATLVTLLLAAIAGIVFPANL